MVWDPDRARTISAEIHHDTIDHHIDEGLEITGKAAARRSGGRGDWRNGALSTERGTGRDLNRPPSTFCWDAQTKRSTQATHSAVDRR